MEISMLSEGRDTGDRSCLTEVKGKKEGFG